MSFIGDNKDQFEYKSKTKGFQNEPLGYPSLTDKQLEEMRRGVDGRSLERLEVKLPDNIFEIDNSSTNNNLDKLDEARDEALANSFDYLNLNFNKALGEFSGDVVGSILNYASSLSQKLRNSPGPLTRRAIAGELLKTYWELRKYESKAPRGSKGELLKESSKLPPEIGLGQKTEMYAHLVPWTPSKPLSLDEVYFDNSRVPFFTRNNIESWMKFASYQAEQRVRSNRSTQKTKQYAGQSKTFGEQRPVELYSRSGKGISRMQIPWPFRDLFTTKQYYIELVKSPGMSFLTEGGKLQILAFVLEEIGYQDKNGFLQLKTGMFEYTPISPYELAKMMANQGEYSLRTGKTESKKLEPLGFHFEYDGSAVRSFEASQVGESMHLGLTNIFFKDVQEFIDVKQKYLEEIKPQQTQGCGSIEWIKELHRDTPHRYKQLWIQEKIIRDRVRYPGTLQIGKRIPVQHFVTEATAKRFAGKDGDPNFLVTFLGSQTANDTIIQTDDGRYWLVNERLRNLHSFCEAVVSTSWILAWSSIIIRIMCTTLTGDFGPWFSLLFLGEDIAVNIGEAGGVNKFIKSMNLTKGARYLIQFLSIARSFKGLTALQGGLNGFAITTSDIFLQMADAGGIEQFMSNLKTEPFAAGFFLLDLISLTIDAAGKKSLFNNPYDAIEGSIEVAKSKAREAKAVDVESQGVKGSAVEPPKPILQIPRPVPLQSPSGRPQLGQRSASGVDMSDSSVVPNRGLVDKDISRDSGKPLSTPALKKGIIEITRKNESQQGLQPESTVKQGAADGDSPEFHPKLRQKAQQGQHSPPKAKGRAKEKTTQDFENPVRLTSSDKTSVKKPNAISKLIEGNPQSKRVFRRLKSLGCEILARDIAVDHTENIEQGRAWLAWIGKLTNQELLDLTSFRRVIKREVPDKLDWYDIHYLDGKARKEVLRLIATVEPSVDAGLSEVVGDVIKSYYNTQGAIGQLHAIAFVLSKYQKFGVRIVLETPIEIPNVGVRVIDIKATVPYSDYSEHIEVKTYMGQLVIHDHVRKQITRDLIYHMDNDWHSLQYLFNPDMANQLGIVNQAILDAFNSKSVQQAIRLKGANPQEMLAKLQNRLTNPTNPMVSTYEWMDLDTPPTVTTPTDKLEKPVSKQNK